MSGVVPPLRHKTLWPAQRKKNKLTFLVVVAAVVVVVVNISI
jgi:hypothetical protein